MDTKREEDAKYKKVRQSLQIEDLNRYGIFTYLVNEHEEITEILRDLVDKHRRKTIFISGSADSYGEYKNGEGENFIHKLTLELVRNGYRIVNGVGEYCLASKNTKIRDVLTLMLTRG